VSAVAEGLRGRSFAKLADWSRSELEAVLDWCSSNGYATIPYGGGSSVVDGVTPPEGYGGIERVVYLLGKGLKQLGHDVTVFGRRGRVSRLRTVDLVKGDWSHRLLGPDHMVLWLDYMSRVYRTLRERNFDLVHEHNEAIGITFASMACRTAPTLVTLHGEVSPALLQLLKGADCSVGLVAISNAQKRTTNGLRWAGMVHNAVETDDIEGPFPPSRKEYLIQLARLNPEKGQHLAIQAARRLSHHARASGKIRPKVTPSKSKPWGKFLPSPHHLSGIAAIVNGMTAIPPIHAKTRRTGSRCSADRALR